MTITPLAGNPINVHCPVSTITYPVIKKMLIGDMYMAPKEVILNSMEDQYFCDRFDMQNYTGTHIVRAGGGIFSLGGVWENNVYSTRICYRGNVTEYTDPQTFLALTAVDPAN